MNEMYGYIAGIIDGEGCIGIHKVIKESCLTYRPNVSVGMADKEPLYLLQSLYGGNITVRNREKDGWLYLYCWQASKEDVVRKLLLDIKSYLLVKNRQADLCLEFILKFPRYRSKGKEEEKEEYFLLCKVLNRSLGSKVQRDAVIEEIDRISV